MIAPVPRTHLRPLTSLRFVAACLIVLLHVRGLFGIPADFGDPFLFGQGVSFFFVLSGFILVYVYLDVSRAGTSSFWTARIARVWPGHIVALLLLLWLLPASRPTGDATSVGSLFANLLLVHTWNPVAEQYYSFNSVSWSVSTELAFYLCFPLLLAGWRQTWHWKLALTLVLACVMIVLGNAGYFPASPPDAQGFRTIIPLLVHPLARLFEFTLGMCAALLWGRLATRHPPGIWTGSLVEILAVFLVVVLMFNSGTWADWAGQRAWIGDAGWTWLRGGGIPALGFAVMITVLALQHGVISQALSLPLLVVLGEISYAIYLIHQILVRHYLNHAQSFEILPPAVTFVLFVALTLVISYLIWALIEKPLRKLITGWWPRHQGDHSWRRPGTVNPAALEHRTWRWSPHVVMALLALLALIAPVAYLTMFRASIDIVSPAYAAELMKDVPPELREIAIGETFVVIGAEAKPTADGVDLQLVWKSTEPQRLDYMVAIHVIDADGQILGNFDRPQDPAKPWIKEGSFWRDVVHLPASALEGASAVAVGLYRGHEGLLPITRNGQDTLPPQLFIALDDVHRVRPQAFPAVRP